MRNSDLCDEIEGAFPGCSGALADSFIEANPDLAHLDSTQDIKVLVPAYMIWCLRNAHRPEELIHDYTLRALAEFGRSKNPEISFLNFKFRCSPDQRRVVAKYLEWCLDRELLLDTEQVQRSLKRWVAST